MVDEKLAGEASVAPAMDYPEAVGQKAPARKPVPAVSPRIRWMARLFVLVVCLGLAEIAARVAGFRPWNPDKGNQESFKVVPGPAMFSRDDEIGHALEPGRQTIMWGKNTWVATHLDKYRRLTRPDTMPPPPPGAKTLWLFGDSFTYGGSINDEETYPYRVQAKHPELSVVDYAWPGQSSIQTLLLMKKLLASQKPPDVAFMGYASFHDGRTLMARANRRSWHPYRSVYPTFPAVRLEGGQLVTKWVPVDYDPLPLEKYSGLMALMAQYYNKADVLLNHGQEVSEGVIEQINAFCKERGVRFVLLGVHNSSRTKDVIRRAASKGIQSADISVNEQDPQNVVLGDGHPNGNGARQFAEKLEPVIAEALAPRP